MDSTNGSDVAMTIIAILLAVLVIMIYLLLLFLPKWVIKYLNALSNIKEKPSGNVAANKVERNGNGIPGLTYRPVNGKLNGVNVFKRFSTVANNKTRIRSREKSRLHKRKFQRKFRDLSASSFKGRSMSDHRLVEKNHENWQQQDRRYESDTAIETLGEQDTGTGNSNTKAIKVPVNRTTTNKIENKHNILKRNTRTESRCHPDLGRLTPHLRSVSSTSTSSGSTVSQKPGRKIKHRSEKKFDHFTLDKSGGFVELSYLTIDFPRDAVSQETQLRLTTLNDQSFGDCNIALITPVFHCSQYNGYDSVSFQFPIKITAKINLNGINNVNDAEVQVTESSLDLKWETREKFKISKNQEFLLLKLQQFAGFRVIIRIPEKLPECDLYHTVYVKRPTGIDDPCQQHFCIIINSAEKNAIDGWEATLRSSAVEVISSTQILQIRPPCTFSADLKCTDCCKEMMPHKICFHIESSKQRYRREFHVMLKKIDTDACFQTIFLEYTAGTTIIIPFLWSISSSRAESCNSSISAIGDNSIGLQQINYFYNCSSPLQAQNITDQQNEPNHPHRVTRGQSSPASYSCEQSSSIITPPRQTSSAPILHDEPSTFDASDFSDLDSVNDDAACVAFTV